MMFDGANVGGGRMPKKCTKFVMLLPFFLAAVNTRGLQRPVMSTLTGPEQQKN